MSLSQLLSPRQACMQVSVRSAQDALNLFVLGSYRSAPMQRQFNSDAPQIGSQKTFATVCRAVRASNSGVSPPQLPSHSFIGSLSIPAPQSSPDSLFFFLSLPLSLTHFLSPLISPFFCPSHAPSQQQSTINSPQFLSPPPPPTLCLIISPLFSKTLKECRGPNHDLFPLIILCDCSRQIHIFSCLFLSFNHILDILDIVSV